jgi:hypothetical protein
MLLAPAAAVVTLLLPKLTIVDSHFTHIFNRQVRAVVRKLLRGNRGILPSSKRECNQQTFTKEIAAGANNITPSHFLCGTNKIFLNRKWHQQF